MIENCVNQWKAGIKNESNMSRVESDIDKWASSLRVQFSLLLNNWSHYGAALVSVNVIRSDNMLSLPQCHQSMWLLYKTHSRWGRQSPYTKSLTRTQRHHGYYSTYHCWKNCIPIITNVLFSRILLLVTLQVCYCKYLSKVQCYPFPKREQFSEGRQRYSLILIKMY